MDVTKKPRLPIYHGSSAVIDKPDLRKTNKYTKDFGPGFYCTTMFNQAVKWARKKAILNTGYVSCYTIEDVVAFSTLNIVYFPSMTESWLDFIVACRRGIPHHYDLVEGPMADDTIFNYVDDYAYGRISREAFWALAKFKYPTHQVVFCTREALNTLSYVGNRAGR